MMETLTAPNGGLVRVSDALVDSFIKSGFAVQEPVAIESPAPKATAKKPSTRTRKTSTKKEA